MTAVVSAPTGLALSIGAALSHRVGAGTLPTKDAPEVGRVYMLAPLFVLSGTGLFDWPDVEIAYFRTRAESIAWGEADIERRMQSQRADVRALLLDAARQARAEQNR